MRTASWAVAPTRQLGRMPMTRRATSAVTEAAIRSGFISRSPPLAQQVEVSARESGTAVRGTSGRIGGGKGAQQSPLEACETLVAGAASRIGQRRQEGAQVAQRLEMLPGLR